MDHTQKTTACRKCKAPVLFIQNKRGNWQIVDAALFIAQQDDPHVIIVLSDGSTQSGVKRGDVGHIDHHATCEFADDFRKE
jgi:hypothetical protein